MAIYYKDLTIGQRLAAYRKKKGFTQEEFGEKLLVSQKLVAAWEIDKRPIKLEYVDDICKILEITTSELLRGKNECFQTACDQLGLSDSAIQYLVETKSHEDDYQESFIDKAEDFTQNHGKLSGIPSDAPYVDGCKSDEIMFIINWLLSHSSGHKLLSSIAKYVLVDSSQCLLYDYNADCESIYPYIECDEIYYKKRIGEGLVGVDPAILRYALIATINNEIDRIRDEIGKEIK